MKVLFDHKVFQLQRYGGVSNAIVEMIDHLPRNIQYEIAIKESDNVYLHQKELIPDLNNLRYTSQKFMNGINFPGKEHLYNFFSKYNIINNEEEANLSYCINEIEDCNYDVFQPTTYNTYFLKYLKKPFVFIIHDIVPELFPQYYNKNNPEILARNVLIHKAAKIVAISENTKNDIINYWNIPEDKIEVIHWGEANITNRSEKRLYEKKYILYVGSRTNYKDFNFFAIETKQFLKQHPDTDVICTGRPFNVFEQFFLKRNGLFNRFKYFYFKPEETYSLYHNAECFVYPSLYEGFGLPILDAFECECPALISRLSCFPEIAGDAALYIDRQKDTSNISEQLNRILNFSIEEKQALIEKGKKRATIFSWEKTSKKYAKLYESII